MKLCKKCNQFKISGGFHKNSKSKDKLAYWCKQCTYECNKKYKKENVQHIQEYHKNYAKKNRENLNTYQREYKKLEGSKINRNKQRKQRLKQDIQYKLSENLRIRLNGALKNNWKSGSAVRDLGCSIDDLKFWFEFWFDEGMSWDNYGNKEGQWSIDHIKPLFNFDLTNHEQLCKACHYINLQPMWHLYNIRKGNKENF